MIWTKGAHQSATFQTFDYSREISPHLYLDRLLLLKVYKFHLKSTEELCLVTLKSDAKFEEKPFCCFKNGKNLVIWSEHSRLKYLHFDWSFSCKLYNIWPKKKVRRSYLSWHWRVMQNLKKKNYLTWKMTWEIWQISTRALGSVKIGTFIGSFRPK